MSPDETSCAVFTVTNQGNYGCVIDLESYKVRDYTIDTKKHVEEISHAKISRDSKFCLSLSGSFEAQLILNNTWNGLQAAEVKLELQIADFEWQNGHNFITVGSDVQIWSLFVDKSGKIVELQSRVLPLPSILNSEIFTAVGVSPNGQRFRGEKYYKLS